MPLWGTSRGQAIAAYRRFMRDGLKDGHRDDLYEVVDQRYLGRDAFVEKVAQRKPDNEVPPVVLSGKSSDPFSHSILRPMTEVV